MPWQVSSAEININGFLVSLHFLLFLSYFLLHSSSIILIPNNMLSMTLRLIVTLRVRCYVYNTLRLVVNNGNLKVVQPEREDKFLRLLSARRTRCDEAGIMLIIKLTCVSIILCASPQKWTIFTNHESFACIILASQVYFF